MIYVKNLLVVKLLFENTSKKKIFGIYRPSAYLEETGNYCTTLRLDIFKKHIEPSESLTITGILESPVGFGDALKEGSVFSIKNGLRTEGRAMVLEIIGYHTTSP